LRLCSSRPRVSTTFVPATNTYTWQRVPTIFRTGIRLTKQGGGAAFRTVNVSAYADNVNWSCVSQGNCAGLPRITSAHGTGNLPDNNWRYRSHKAYIMGIFLYQMEPITGGSNPGTMVINICNVADSPSVEKCVFSANSDIYVNVNDVAALQSNLEVFLILTVSSFLITTGTTMLTTITLAALICIL
jgi:hypothetical protein